MNMNPSRWLFAGASLTLFACGEGFSNEGSTATSVPSWEAFQANPPLTWEAFRDSVDREPVSPYRFIVDGDIPLADEENLYTFYQTWLAEEYANTHTDGQALTVRNVLGADVLWPASQRFELTYCISDSFGSKKATLIAAMDRAARSWDDFVGVRFIYRPDQDTNCTSSNNNVVFNVSPIAASYVASAFFPDDARSKRQLFVTDIAFTTTSGGRDLEGILRHETGHILGFRHEHIHISCTEESTADSRQITSYDVNSVMHYPQCRPSGTGGYRQTSLDYSGAVQLYGSAYVTFASPSVNGLLVGARGILVSSGTTWPDSTPAETALRFCRDQGYMEHWTFTSYVRSSAYSYVTEHGLGNWNATGNNGVTMLDEIRCRVRPLTLRTYFHPKVNGYRVGRVTTSSVSRAETVNQFCIREGLSAVAYDYAVDPPIGTAYSYWTGSAWSTSGNNSVELFSQIRCVNP